MYPWNPSDRIIEDIEGALQMHDWMRTSQCLEQMSQSLMEQAANHEFDAIQRLSYRFHLAAKDYLLRDDCMTEIGHSLAKCTSLFPEQAIQVKNLDVMKSVVAKIGSVRFGIQKDEMFSLLLHSQHPDFCRLLYSHEEIQVISGVDLGIQTSATNTVAAPTHERHQMLNRCVELIHCAYLNDKAIDAIWIDLARRSTDAIKESVVMGGYGANVAMALRELGLTELSDHYARQALERPKIGDVAHFNKLSSCGIKLKKSEQIILTKKIAMQLSRERLDSIDGKIALTLGAAIMCEDFERQDDFAHTTELTKVKAAAFYPMLGMATNHLWKTRLSERRSHLIALMDVTLNTKAKIERAEPHLDEDLLKQLKLGRERVLGRDLGL